jgi:hypothetical protein
MRIMLVVVVSQLHFLHIYVLKIIVNFDHFIEFGTLRNKFIRD